MVDDKLYPHFSTESRGVGGAERQKYPTAHPIFNVYMNIYE